MSNAPCASAGNVAIVVVSIFNCCNRVWRVAEVLSKATSFLSAFELTSCTVDSTLLSVSVCSPFLDTINTCVDKT